MSDIKRFALVTVVIGVVLALSIGAAVLASAPSAHSSRGTAHASKQVCPADAHGRLGANCRHPVESSCAEILKHDAEGNYIPLRLRKKFERYIKQFRRDGRVECLRGEASSGK